VDGTYIYIDDQLDDLITALHENTVALLDETTKGIETKAEVGTVLSEEGVFGVDGVSVLEHM
jgi:hypothetical protein